MNSSQPQPPLNLGELSKGLGSQVQQAPVAQEPSLFYDKHARKVKDFKPYGAETYLGQEYLDPKRSKYWELGGLGMDDSPEAVVRHIAHSLDHAGSVWG